MNKHYSGISRAAQQAIEAAGGSAVYPERDTIYPLHGIWTVSYPEGTTHEECYYWSWLHHPERAVRLKTCRVPAYAITLPTGATLLESLRPEGEPQLLLITEEDEQKYMLSRKRDFLAEESPEITRTEAGKEVLVPGWRRLDGGSIFIDGFGAGRPGFSPLFVLFVYPPDGTHAIYVLSPEERNDPEKRYVHLHRSMRGNEYNSLDRLLEDCYNIDTVGTGTTAL
jgi:hypothetical protein